MEDVQSLSLLFFPDSEAYRPGKSFSTSGLSNSILFVILILQLSYNAVKDTSNIHYVQIHNPHSKPHLTAIFTNLQLPWKRKTRHLATLGQHSFSLFRIICQVREFIIIVMLIIIVVVQICGSQFSDHKYQFSIFYLKYCNTTLLQNVGKHLHTPHSITSQKTTVFNSVCVCIGQIY